MNILNSASRTIWREKSHVQYRRVGDVRRDNLGGNRLILNPVLPAVEKAFLDFTSGSRRRLNVSAMATP